MTRVQLSLFFDNLASTQGQGKGIDTILLSMELSNFDFDFAVAAVAFDQVQVCLDGLVAASSSNLVS